MNATTHNDIRHAYVTLATKADKVAVQFDARAENWSEAATALVFKLNNVTNLVERPAIVGGKPHDLETREIISVASCVAWLSHGQRNP